MEGLRARLQRVDAEIDRGEGLEFDEHTTKDLASEINGRGIKRRAGFRKTGPPE